VTFVPAADNANGQVTQVCTGILPNAFSLSSVCIGNDTDEVQRHACVWS
jgi:hypothetical protein